MPETLCGNHLHPKDSLRVVFEGRRQHHHKLPVSSLTLTLTLTLALPLTATITRLALPVLPLAPTLLLGSLLLMLRRGLLLTLRRGLLLMLRRGLPCRLHLIPVYRASLLIRGLGWSCPLNLFAASLLWLRARGKLGALPGWCRRRGALGIRRPLGFLLRHPLPILLMCFRPILLRRRGGHSGRWRLFVLPYQRIT